MPTRTAVRGAQPARQGHTAAPPPQRGRNLLGHQRGDPRPRRRRGTNRGRGRSRIRPARDATRLDGHIRTRAHIDDSHTRVQRAGDVFPGSGGTGDAAHHSTECPLAHGKASRRRDATRQCGDSWTASFRGNDWLALRISQSCSRSSGPNVDPQPHTPIMSVIGCE